MLSSVVSRSIVVGVSIAVAVSAGLALNVSKESHGLPGVSLARPAFAEDSAFPEHAAALSAWVRVPGIDALAGSDALSRVLDVGDNYVWGIVKYDGEQHVSVKGYLDSDGLAVTFLSVNESSARAISGASGANRLDTALCNLLAAVSVSCDTTAIHYFHFQYPTATDILFATKDGSGEIHFSLPSSTASDIIEASYYTTGFPLYLNDVAVARDSGVFANVVIDGVYTLRKSGISGWCSLAIIYS